MYTYAIYQIRPGEAGHYYRFVDMDHLRKHGMAVQPALYDKVFEGPVSSQMAALGTDNLLEMLYHRFNAEIPQDFAGHSMSVSDVIVLSGNGEARAYYVNSFGFEEVPELAAYI